MITTIYHSIRHHNRYFMYARTSTQPYHCHTSPHTSLSCNHHAYHIHTTIAVHIHTHTAITIHTYYYYHTHTSTPRYTQPSPSPTLYPIHDYYSIHHHSHQPMHRRAHAITMPKCSDSARVARGPPSTLMIHAGSPSQSQCRDQYALRNR